VQLPWGRARRLRADASAAHRAESEAYLREIVAGIESRPERSAKGDGRGQHSVPSGRHARRSRLTG